MFERFTGEARQAVRAAVREAQQRDQRQVGTVHLLLALLAEPDGRAAQVLRDVGVSAERLTALIDAESARQVALFTAAEADALRAIGIDPDEVVARLERSFGPTALRRPAPTRRRGLRRWRDGRFASGTKKSLELALREAIRLRHRRIGTEHILLGLLREERGTAARALVAAGLDLTGLRGRVAAVPPTPT